MIRVCGTTYDHTINYGSCLQAYALSKVMNSISVDGEQVEYHLVPLREFKDYPRSHSVKGIVANHIIKMFRKSFVQFESRYMQYADIHFMSDLDKLNDKYDVFVCGGDAVWRPDLNGMLSAYYMDYAKKYLFSYSASFGKAEFSEAEIEFTRKMLQNYREFGIREETGKEIIERCGLSQKVTTVADPVLLLTRQEWDQISDQKINHEKYILAYATHVTENYKEFVKALSRHTGLKVIYTACSPKTALSQGLTKLHTPQKWLSLIRDAEYVVSESFHATVLSLIFHKKFFSIVGGEINSGINIRTYSLLLRFNLVNRMFSDVPEKWDLSEPDFSMFDENIIQTRQLGIDYIRRNLHKAMEDRPIK